MSGTVNIARSIFDHTVFADEPKTEREAWIWLIMEASWKPMARRLGNVVVNTERGQLAASIRFLAGAWKWSAPRVQRFLKRLQKMEMIASKTDTGVTLITIINYDEYQNSGQASDTAAIQQRYSSDTNEKKDEIRGKEGSLVSVPSDKQACLDLPSEKPAKRKVARATEISPDWSPSAQNVSYAQEKGFSLPQIDQQAERFRDYHLSKGSTFKCWDAAWRTWVMNALRFQKSAHTALGSEKADEDPNVRWLREARMRNEEINRRIAAGEEF